MKIFKIKNKIYHLNLTKKDFLDRKLWSGLILLIAFVFIIPCGRDYLDHNITTETGNYLLISIICFIVGNIIAEWSKIIKWSK